jgi:hypothetical protein
MWYPPRLISSQLRHTMSSTTTSLGQAKRSNPSLQLIKLRHSFYLYQYPIALPLPPTLVSLLSVPPTPRADARHGDGFLTVSKTTEEWSVMTQQDHQIDLGEGGQVEGPWGCLKVRGPMVLSACLPRADPSTARKSWLTRSPPTT